MIRNISALVARSNGASSPRQSGLGENTSLLHPVILSVLWGRPQAQVESGASFFRVCSATIGLSSPLL